MSGFFWNSDLHLINCNIRDLQSIFFSPIARKFQTPTGDNLEVQCYFYTIQQSKAVYISFVIFLEPIKKKVFVYEYKGNPYPATELFQVESEGLYFCAQNGFDLDDPQIWIMKEMDRVRWLQNQCIFNCTPEGEFSIQPSCSNAIADGKSLIKLISDPIPTPCGVIPIDGTKFWVTTNMGKIVGNVIESKDNSSLISSDKGMLYFNLQAPKNKGRCVIKVISEDKKAFASTVIHFKSGLPGRKIILKSVAKFLIADGENSVEITSENIMDTFGNIVEDNTEIAVSSTLGRIFTEKSYFKYDLFIIPIQSGRIQFKFIAGTKVGLAEITTWAINSDIKSQLKILLIPGTPYGSFPVISKELSIPADGSSVVEIEAGPITDHFGNVVADDHIMIIQSSAGYLLTDPSDNSDLQSFELHTKEGKLVFWLKSSNKPGRVYIAVRNFDRTSAGSCSLEFTKINA
ncbi:MAG: hypothetical protein A2161_01620 [Candidatus Schekmanbacteria bacterium RBG_13_48_7]|uniref:Uncharacterized protein n=1 Tax=Candidatus Schekmanbacteria bacterium RBG_13_48_7 TaxID=1817878 RepID=A0A1F7RQA0_9BACT|nr:MAG: hypothetical protein A2161_01620 [Candidatus Schekmanbacteria bacterium RBG_13_48_7]